MPLPRSLGRFNRVVTNRLLRPLAGRLASFGELEHRGRRSGREYRTMVNWWHDEDSAIIALTYGPDVDWLKNLRAAGGGSMRSRGITYRLGPPEVIGEEGMARMPAPARVVLRLIGVDRFAVMPLLKGSVPPT